MQSLIPLTDSRCSSHWIYSLRGFARLLVCVRWPRERLAHLVPSASVPSRASSSCSDCWRAQETRALLPELGAECWAVRPRVGLKNRPPGCQRPRAVPPPALCYDCDAMASHWFLWLLFDDSGRERAESQWKNLIGHRVEKLARAWCMCIWNRLQFLYYRTATSNDWTFNLRVWTRGDQFILHCLLNLQRLLKKNSKCSGTLVLYRLLQFSELDCILRALLWPLFRNCAS